MSIYEYNTDPALNQYISSIYIGEGWLAPDANNAFRQLMADIAAFLVGGGGGGATINQEFVATDGQTAFTTNSLYTPAYVSVFVNGSKLSTGEFTATDGSHVTLVAPCNANDIITVHSVTGDAMARAASMPAGVARPWALGRYPKLNVPDRAALAALKPGIPGETAWLNEGERAGWFVLKTGDSPFPSTSQGLCVQSSTAGFSWWRDWDDITGRPEWFGARRNDPAFDNAPAIQDCLNNCPVTQLGGGVYYTAGPIYMNRNGTCLFGVSHTQTDCPSRIGSPMSATQIMCTSSTSAILILGTPSGPNPNAFTETLRVEALTVNRSVSPNAGPGPYDGCIGVDCLWIVNCHLERVFSMNSAIGFRFWGTVENYIIRCGALRDKEGTDPANDNFVGFFIDQNSPGPWNGGNASLTLDKCRCFPLTANLAPSLTYSAGVKLVGGWVDVFIDGFECGSGIQYGIHGTGTGQFTNTVREEDLWIRHCVLDPGSICCIALTDAGKRTAITITDNYMACGGAATALAVQRMGGGVTIANNQLLTSNTPASTGMSLLQLTGVQSTGNIIQEFAVPVILDHVVNGQFRDLITNVAANAYPAVVMRDCMNCIVMPTVHGDNTGVHTAGIEMQGSTNVSCEVNMTGIAVSAISIPYNKLLYNNAQVLETGYFGNQCLATGLFV